MREVIYQAALRLFLERGYDYVTVDEIAKEAGISRRTFFHMFPSKEDVLLAYLDGVEIHMVQLLATRPNNEPLLISLRHAFKPLLDLHTEDALARNRIRLILDTPALRARHLKLLDSWAQLLAEQCAQKLGLYSIEGLPRLTAWIAIITLDVALHEWSRQQDKALLPYVDETFAKLSKVMRAKPKKNRS
ncbi:TetR/AcrR family transcriptional regulator [Meiothermus sp.]|uniref:TetR/AcrR family transcriptional regulator n=1 Tax=Meiothermus sp. TaxID=1955249 RepID=UPI00260A636F|nr:TetR/AcrR family transcriptional regulator [Meiothermus sp.]